MTKKLGLILAVILLTTLLGCEVVCPPCPECPPPEVTCYPAEVTVNPEITVEPDEVTIKVYPEVECPEVNVSADIMWPYKDPRYDREVLEVAIRNHLNRIDYYKPVQRIDAVFPVYKGNGIWTVRVKWLSSGSSVSYDTFIFSEWTDSFVE